MYETQLDAARDALRAGRLELADDLVRAVLEQEPLSVGALNILGTIEIRRGRPVEAERAFATAADHDDGPRSAMNRAMALDMAGRRSDAVASYRALLQRFPDHHVARRRLIKGIFATGDTSGVVDAADQAPAGFDWDAETCHLVAMSCLATGAPDRAESWIGRSLELDPNHLPAGLVKASWLIGDRHHADAVALLQRLEGVAPDSIDVHRLLGRSLRALGRHEEAVPHLRKAVEARDQDQEVRSELAHSLRKLGRHDEAAGHYRTVLDADPTDWKSCEALARSLIALKRTDDAKEVLRAALDTGPNDVMAWNNLTIEFKTAGDKELAVTYFRKACACFPDNASLHYNIGFTLNELTHAEEAERYLRRAVRINPKYAKAWNALGVALAVQYRAAEAEQVCLTSLEVGGDTKSIWLNLGIARRAQGRFAESVTALRRAIALDQNYAEANHNLAITMLMLGEIEQGFKLYDWRFGLPDFPSPKRAFRQREWRGEPLKDAGLLVYMEQGMGDEVMFSWYLHHLVRIAGTLVVDCDERLIPLFARTFPGVEFVPRSPRGAPRTREKDIVYKLPAGHLPKFFWAETRARIYDTCHLAHERYVRLPGHLTPDPVRTRHWADWLGARAGGRPLIGISWRSALHNRFRDIQYMAPEEIARAVPPGSAVVNLQYAHEDFELEALDRLGREHGFQFIHPEGIDLKDDLDDVMALIANLDLVVSPLISVPWMAGALGVPAWVFRTSEVSRIWQQLGMPYVPWCPSMRLFYRHPLVPWDDTIAKVRGELDAWMASR